jgi:hypothetical protein
MTMQTVQWILIVANGASIALCLASTLMHLKAARRWRVADEKALRAEDDLREIARTYNDELARISAALPDLRAFGEGEVKTALTSKDREQYQFWQGWCEALRKLALHMATGGGSR